MSLVVHYLFQGYVFVCICLFVCQQGYAKTTPLIFSKFGGKLAHGPWKIPLDFGGNQDHVTLGLALGRRRTLFSAGELSLSCARRVTTLWLSRPLSVSQHGQLSLPSLWGQLLSSNPCYSGLRRQTAEGVVRGVPYRPRQRVLLAARLECRLAAGSRPRNRDEHRCLALWAVGEPTSHWGLRLVLSFVTAN